MPDDGLFLPRGAGTVLGGPRIARRQFPFRGARCFAERDTRRWRGCGCLGSGRLLALRLGWGLGQRAFDEEQGLRGDGGRSELARGGHAVNNFADARAGGEGREKNFRFLGGGGDGGTEIEGEQRGE